MKITNKMITSILLKSIEFIFQMIALVAGCILVIKTAVDWIGPALFLPASELNGNEIWPALLATFIIFADIYCSAATLTSVINDYKKFFDRF